MFKAQKEREPPGGNHCVRNALFCAIQLLDDFFMGLHYKEAVSILISSFQ